MSSYLKSLEKPCFGETPALTEADAVQLAIAYLESDAEAKKSARWAAIDMTLDIHLAAWMQRLLKNRWPEEWEEGLYQAGGLALAQWAREQVKR